MIVNRTYEIPIADASSPGQLIAAMPSICTGEPLRWFVSRAGPTHLTIESTEYSAGLLPAVRLPTGEPPSSGKCVAISLIPTGIGCALGGYAGDAGPATALLACAVDFLITNPNAVNASNLIAIDSRIVYAEGYTLDRFSLGETTLRVPRANRIGIIIERAHDTALTELFNVINAVRAVHGVDIVDYIVTDEPIGTQCTRHGSGAYVGQIERPDVLLAAGQRLIAAGANALAVTTNVLGLDADAYASHFHGNHPNPVGGAEAVVSHLLTRVFQVPSAHAPMLNFSGFADRDFVVDARAASEFISTSGLACILIGLRRAPQVNSNCPASVSIGLDDVIAVVAPASALGGVPVLAAAQRRVPVIAVRNNRTILSVTAAGLGLPAVLEVENYAEAAGMLLALKAGISIESLGRPLVTLGDRQVSACAEVAASPV